MSSEEGYDSWDSHRRRGAACSAARSRSRSPRPRSRLARRLGPRPAEVLQSEAELRVKQVIRVRQQVRHQQRREDDDDVDEDEEESPRRTLRSRITQRGPGGGFDQHYDDDDADEEDEDEQDGGRNWRAEAFREALGVRTPARQAAARRRRGGYTLMEDEPSETMSTTTSSGGRSPVTFRVTLGSKAQLVREQGQRKGWKGSSASPSPWRPPAPQRGRRVRGRVRAGQQWRLGRKQVTPSTPGLEVVSAARRLGLELQEGAAAVKERLRLNLQRATQAIGGDSTTPRRRRTEV